MQLTGAPGELATALNPDLVNTPALDLIDRSVGQLRPSDRLIITVPPQEGLKSTRIAWHYPLWLLHHDPSLHIAIASYDQGVGRRLARRIRASLPGIGLSPRDSAGDYDWRIEAHDGGVFGCAVGTALSGRAVDMWIIDDPIKNKLQAESATAKQAMWDWWTESAQCRLTPRGMAVLTMSRWATDDLAGRLSEDPSWQLVNIPALCEHNDDPLGRKPGEYLISIRGQTRHEWCRLRANIGEHDWRTLYQGEPGLVAAA